MKARSAACLQQEDLHAAQRAVLTSLTNHWSGLVLFAKHPQVPMDNNAAERSLRNPVTGRKRYYGSGRVWSAELAATMFTVLRTVQRWGLNPRHWLTAYLTACADHGGQTPADLSDYLPWDLNEERREILSRPAPVMEPFEAVLFEDTG